MSAMAVMAVFAVLNVGLTAESQRIEEKKKRQALKETKAETRRRYSFNKNIAQQKLDSINEEYAFAKTIQQLKTLKAKSDMVALSAERGVTGKSIEGQFQELNIADLFQTNKLIMDTKSDKINVANQLLADRIDRDTTIARANRMYAPMSEIEKTMQLLSSLTSGASQGASIYNTYSAANTASGER